MALVNANKARAGDHYPKASPPRPKGAGKWPESAGQMRFFPVKMQCCPLVALLK